MSAQGFWADRAVLVTGAGGFIGSHLAEELARRGAHVRALVRYNGAGSAGWLDHAAPELLPRIEVFQGDLRDGALVADATRGVDTVFHLGALIAIPYSYRAPLSYLQVNVEGTLHVLEAARSQGVRRVVHTSTSEVYGTARFAPITEEHPLQAQSPYAASKVGADALAESHFRSFGTPVAIARPFNTFGPRQSTRAIIPAILAQVLGGAEELRLGALSPTRDLNFVSNTVDGMIALAEAGGAVHGRVFNFGSGREVSIGELAVALLRLAGRDIPIVEEAARLRPAASEVGRLLADSARAREELEWSPRVSLEEGLRRCIDGWTGEWAARARAGYHV
ncbi:MAG: GDP-mannose 4,6-dehydratase [Candidatus Sumerlaeia bacterium]|nr:GDP-mannose 4,6-dehydratase [Candidatus Sumerlaeia bacterium]